MTYAELKYNLVMTSVLPYKLGEEGYQMLMELVDKQIAEKPQAISYEPSADAFIYGCPICGKRAYRKDKRCDCGQLLDWEGLQ